MYATTSVEMYKIKHPTSFQKNHKPVTESINHSLIDLMQSEYIVKPCLLALGQVYVGLGPLPFLRSVGAAALTRLQVGSCLLLEQSVCLVGTELLSPHCQDSEVICKSGQSCSKILQLHALRSYESRAALASV